MVELQPSKLVMRVRFPSPARTIALVERLLLRQQQCRRPFRVQLVYNGPPHPAQSIHEGRAAFHRCSPALGSVAELTALDAGFQPQATASLVVLACHTYAHA
jgi:hypothetical protein